MVKTLTPFNQLNNFVYKIPFLNLAFVAVGGYESLVTQYFDATADNQSHSDPTNSESSLCGEVPKDAMHLFRDAAPGKSDLPWTGIVFGLSISSIWYWCSDQVRW